MFEYSYQFTLDKDLSSENMKISNEWFDEDINTIEMVEIAKNDGLDFVENLQWRLITNNMGIITVGSNEILTLVNLLDLEEWLENQNSDGIGESYTQQDFSENSILSEIHILS